MSIREKYDWIVLGDSPGALMSGVLAAARGLSVLILPKFPHEKPSLEAWVTKKKQCLDPEANWVPGVTDPKRGLWARMIEACDPKGEFKSHFVSESSLLGILTPHARIELSSDIARLDSELKREFGEVATSSGQLGQSLSELQDSVEGFWRRLPDRLTLVTQNGKSKKADLGSMALSRVVRGQNYQQIVKSTLARVPEIQEALQGSWVGLSDSELVHRLDLNWISSCVTSLSGAGISGGMTGFRKALLSLATKKGAQVEEKGECKRIFLDRGRLSGIQVGHVASMVQAQGAVLGTSISEAEKIFEKSGSSLFSRQKPGLKPTGWKFTLGITISQDAVSPGLSRRNIWFEHGAPALEIEIGDPKHYGLNDSESCLIFLRTVLPFRNETLDSDYLRTLSGRMFRQLTEILPYSDFNVSQVFPDFRVGVEELKQVIPYKNVSEIPANLWVYPAKGIGSRSGLEGLFLASRESYPGLGAMGPLVAGIEATAWIAHRMGMSGPIP